jgi:hypothetical protein
MGESRVTDVLVKSADGDIHGIGCRVHVDF